MYYLLEPNDDVFDILKIGRPYLDLVLKSVRARYGYAGIPIILNRHSSASLYGSIKIEGDLAVHILKLRGANSRMSNSLEFMADSIPRGMSIGNDEYRDIVTMVNNDCMSLHRAIHHHLPNSSSTPYKHQCQIIIEHRLLDNSMSAIHGLGGQITNRSDAVVTDRAPQWLIDGKREEALRRERQISEAQFVAAQRGLALHDVFNNSVPQNSLDPPDHDRIWDTPLTKEDCIVQNKSGREIPSVDTDKEVKISINKLNKRRKHG